MMWTVFKYNPEYKWARDALIAVCSQCDTKDNLGHWDTRRGFER